MQDLKISILQSDLKWQNPGENLKSFGEKISSIKGSHLIVLPEMFTTGFSMNVESQAVAMDSLSLRWMKEMASKSKSVITGSLIIREENKFYNRLIWMRPDGTFEKYDKRHLFRMAEEDKYFSAGNERLVVELNGWKICPLVCYDLRFPVWSRNKFKKQANEFTADFDLLIYVANWPEKRRKPWSTLLPARAVENLCYSIGLNRVGEDGKNISYSGDSAAYDFFGETIASCKPSNEEILTFELDKKRLEDFRKSFPAGLDADEFEIKN